MKRILSIILMLMIIISTLPAVTTVASTNCKVTDNVIDITDKTVLSGMLTAQVKTISISGANVLSATEEETTINVVLDSNTNPVAELTATFNAGVTAYSGPPGQPPGVIVSHSGNTCILSNGSGAMNIAVTVANSQATSMKGTANYTINFTTIGASTDEEKPATITIVTNLSEGEVKYTQGKTATTLTVEAEHSGGESVTYQWYSNTVKGTEGAVLIEGASKNTYIPATDTIGTTYYYAVVSCGELTATTKFAMITVEVPVLRFNTNLSKSEVKYIQGKNATALTVEAEYTGITENTIIYQWYSYTESIENATVIEGETSANYTPLTGAVGTTYYYVIATCGELNEISEIAKITVEEVPVLNVTDNVIDITDKRVYSRSRYYADAVNIKISGATVEKATEDGTTVNIVLAGVTGSSATVSVEFGTVLNQCTMEGTKGEVKLKNGKAQLNMTLTGVYYSSLKASCTYTLNFSLGEGPQVPPVRIKEADSADIYSGVAVKLDLENYFKYAKTYYLVEENELISLDDGIYTFMSFTEGVHTLVFASSNDNGFCDEYVTVTIEVTGIKSGAYLDIKTSNGSVNYVMFTDAEGNEIEGLIAYLDGTVIKVDVPRDFSGNGKIKAIFDLTQNSNGYPKLSTSNSFNSTNDTKVYTTTLSSGIGNATMYLYNSKPGATNNVYTTYTINYSITNEAPVLADGQNTSEACSTTADKHYSIDLDGIFTDPDNDDAITGWKVSVNGSKAIDAVVDEENVYSFQSNDAGVYTLEFYAMDNYNAVSIEKYTVILTIENANTTYDVTATVNATDCVPVFYYSEDAKEGTELSAIAQGNVYTVKVPENVSMISWRADGVGMNASVSAENNEIILVKPTFAVKADDAIDEEALITVKHSSLNVVGSDNNYLLLSGEKYNITAMPGANYDWSWKEGKLENCIISTNIVEINLVSKDIVFTIPCFAELTVSEASKVQGIAPKVIAPVKTSEADYTSGTKTATYNLTNDKVYEYRVSVPEDNVNYDRYVTYVATFTKADVLSITITKEQIEAGDKDRTTLDRDVTSNRGRNVADLYTNVNTKGYKKLSVGDNFKLIATRNYRGVNADWLMNGNYYYVEPDFHYTVVDENGQENNSVVTVDENGNVMAVGEGTAIIMITYDAMTLNHEPGLSDGAIGDYPSTPNDFYGAIWPENTGVFVVSVGAGDSGITTGMTINGNKATGQKVSGKYIDAELDVIYFIGESGKYTFVPGTQDVSVYVSNPTVSDTLMRFTGFKAVSTNEDGSVTVPLTPGRNIVKLVKDGKAEYQVITAKETNVKINGEPLETATVTPGQKVKIEFDNLFAPVNRMAIYNTSTSVVYSDVSGWEGKVAGNARGSMGEYTFASYDAKRIVEHFVTLGSDDSGYSNSQVTTAGELTVPVDYIDEYFTLSGGSFNIGGFMPYLLGSHYEKLGVTPPASTTSDNINCYLGHMPDISIPVKIDRYTETEVSEDGKTFTVTPVNIKNGTTVILALYDGNKLVEMQKKTHQGNEIQFYTTKKYTSAKVMIWENLLSIKPITVVEGVKLH